MELEEVEAAQHLAAADVNTLTTEFMARLAESESARRNVVRGPKLGRCGILRRGIRTDHDPEPVRPDVSGIAKKLVEIGEIEKAQDLTECH